MQVGNGHVFCNALPLTKQSFKLEATAAHKDFISHYMKSRKEQNRGYQWSDYEKELVLPYQKMKKAFTKYGFRFIDECSFDDYRQEINNEHNIVTILFSHCIRNGQPNEEIEFYNLMVRSDDILAIIPSHPPRIFDFAVCNSRYLFYRLQSERPQSPSSFSCDNIPLSIWIVIYSETFYRMIVQKKDFIDAQDEVFRKARENSNNFLNHKPCQPTD